MDPSQNSSSQQTQPAAAVPPGTTEAVRDQDKMMLFLCYFGIFSVVPFAVVKDSDYVRWHAKQGMTLCAAAFVFWIGWWIMSLILRVVHLGFLGVLLSLPIAFGLMAIWLVALVRAFKGERWRIPLVADLADIW
jgi:uncharacterized membrane protein